MPFEDVFSNVLLMSFSYAYVLALIVVSGKLDKTVHVSRKSARSLAWTARSLGCKSVVRFDFEKPGSGFFSTVGLGLSLDRVLKRLEKARKGIFSTGK